MNVLVVDDSADTREFCELIARMFSMDVMQAHNADAAVKKLKSEVVPDLVLLDLMMPGSPPGLIIETLRADPRFLQTRIVIMSALREVGRIARDMGADGSLRKPFDMAAFVDMLRKYSLTSHSEELMSASAR